MLALLVLALIAGALAWNYEPRVEAALRSSLTRSRVLERRELLLEVAHETGVDVNLLGAVMIAESSGRAGVRSHKGALGLFQLMPATAAEQAQRLGLPPPDEQKLLEDPRLNARLGARYLAWLLARQHGDAERALIAYNAGPGRLGRWIEESGSYEAWRAERAANGSPVLAYATKVLRLRDEFREQGLFEPDAVSPILPVEPPVLAPQPDGAPTALVDPHEPAGPIGADRAPAEPGASGSPAPASAPTLPVEPLVPAVPVPQDGASAQSAPR